MSVLRFNARCLTVLLIALNVCVAGLLIERAWHGTDTGLLLATAPKPFAIPDLAIDPPNRGGGLGSLQEQPLFYASRHFYTPPPPSAAPTAPPRPDYRLVGTFVIPSRPAVALLSGPGGVSRKVKPGDDLNGWSVEAIEGGRVILRYQSETFEISGAAKGGNAGLQIAPIARTAQAAPSDGIRVLGNAAPGAVGTSQDSYVAPHPNHQNPHFYRPPPK